MNLISVIVKRFWPIKMQTVGDMVHKTLKLASTVIGNRYFKRTEPAVRLIGGC